jgi:8-oxo-dGTP pyrophosphatase MutT (NUDIX family)
MKRVGWDRPERRDGEKPYATSFSGLQGIGRDVFCGFAPHGSVTRGLVALRSKPGGVRRAAVVVPIVSGPEPAILFIRRAPHLRRNAGQIAFPGGLVDAADRDDLEQTALREMEEEIGVGRDRVALVGRLPDALVINRTVLVSPFVGVVDAPLRTTLDRNEVDEAFTVPLTRIVEPGALH